MKPTVMCVHQERLVADSLAEARAFGAALKMTEAIRIATSTETIASIDATPEQHDQCAHQFIRLLFWAEGIRCAKCGHIATGPLTEYSAEDVKRWNELRNAAE